VRARGLGSVLTVNLPAKITCDRSTQQTPLVPVVSAHVLVRVLASPNVAKVIENLPARA
jgi:hypothetical protein